MRITFNIMRKLGFIRTPLRENPFDLFDRNANDTYYPFNQMQFLYKKKACKIMLKTDNTIYDCSTLSKLIVSVYFAGVNHGYKQKIQEVKKVLEIKDN